MVNVSDAGPLAGSPGLALRNLESCLSPGEREGRGGKERGSMMGAKGSIFMKDFLRSGGKVGTQSGKGYSPYL